MNNWSTLTALSPLDGRYASQTLPLKEYFSEAGLIRYRLLVEALYLIELLDFLKIKKINLSSRLKIIAWINKLQPADLVKVKNIEKEIRHDVKAGEYFFKANLDKFGLKAYAAYVHWGLTSEDVSNLAYGLMVSRAKEKIIIPQELQLIKVLLQMAKDYKNIVMPARTHGQIAVPTTVGKELIVFASRAAFFLEKIIDFKLGGKLNGAVGNFNAQVKIYPQKDWLSFSKKFITRLGLEPTLLTTQIEPSCRLTYFLDNLRQLNNIWLDLACDCWLYISLNYFSQKVVAKEVGSSTMPQKINPIDFENAEGNLHLANSLLTTLGNKLPISRLQRDLSDSTIKRNLGAAFGYSLLGRKSLERGLKKISPNKQFLDQEIENHPEMLAEALQLKLKTWGKDKAYEKIKTATRGKETKWPDLVKKLNLTKKQQESLLNWQVKDYLGLAIELTNIENRRIKKMLKIP